MEGVFNDSEFDTGETEEPEQAANQLLEELVPAPAPSRPQPQVTEESESDDYMSLVDQRLEVAQYYRLLLGEPLFDKDTAASRIVEREHRAFIRERLEVLLSIRQEQPAPVPQSQFTEQEISALKVMIAKMRERGMVEAAKETPPPAPSPSRVAPIQAPAPVARQQRPAPQVARRASPVRAPDAAPAIEPPVAPKAQAPAQKLKKKGPAITVTKTIEDPNNPGQMVEIQVPRIQRPAGAMPFPADMSSATNNIANSRQLATSGGAAGTAGGSIGGAALSAVIANVLKS